MRTTIVTIGLLAFCSVAGAQEVRERKQVQVFTRSIPGPGIAVSDAPHQFMASELDWREEQVKGLPYSAEAVSESTQTLADGNRISRKNTTQLYRDSEGRTRREETINAIGPWASGSPHKLIFVNDPVAKVNWVIDPQRQEARKMSRTVTIDTGEAGEGSVSFEPAAGSEGIKHELRTEDVTISVSGGMVAGTAATSGRRVRGEPGMAVAMPAIPAIAAAGGPTMMFLRDDMENANRESLGKRTMEGVEAEGTRTTVTTPAGEIGNDRPIITESERWYSPELKVTLMTRHSDPRQGETIYKLTNLRRGEPDAALFQPPTDYKVIEAGSQVIHMKHRTAPK